MRGRRCESLKLFAENETAITTDTERLRDARDGDDALGVAVAD